MDLQTTLTVITVGGLAISFIGGLFSQIWKGSIEVEGQFRKQLTPAGWMSLGIALVGLSASVASELIRVNIRNNDKVAAEVAEKQKMALEAQQAQWRQGMQTMLTEARDGIARNVEDTIKGFADGQQRFTETQTQILSSRQDVLESVVRNTNQIIVAGQPLTSLSFRWQFRSADAALWDTMTKGAAAIDENNRSVQGGVPQVPFDIMDYEAELLPLLRYIARLGDSARSNPDPADPQDPPKVDDPDPGAATQRDDSADRDASVADKPAEDDNQPEEKGKDRAIVVLIPLDESQNAVLSFGDIGGAEWYDKRGASATISAGFVIQQTLARPSNSIARAISQLTTDRDGGESTYGIEWELDALTLANAIDRRVATIPSTARLPKTLKVAILYDIKTLPFKKSDFTDLRGNLWIKRGFPRKEFPLDIAELSEMELAVEVNGLSDARYNYRLASMYRMQILTEDIDEIETKCVVLEFEFKG